VVQTALCPVTIGREREMERLRDALEAGCAGDGRTVVLAGDAGLGKTRLCTDLRRLAAGRGAATMWGGCSEAEFSLPYLPFLEAIGNHLAQADVPALRRELGAGHPELAWLFPQLGIEAPPRDPSDPVQGKLRLFEAVLALLRTGAEPGGTLLVLENLHGADASSRELLEYLVRRLRGARIMLLVTCRLDGLDRGHPLAVMVEHWRRAGLAERLDLTPLSADRVGDMIRETVGIDTVGFEVSRLLSERSEGNPFVLEEILKDALDRGAVSRVDPAWRGESLRRLRLPRTVRDSVLGRLEHLPEPVADVLHCASVLGRSFDYPLLVELSGRDGPDVQAALRTCVRHQLVEEDPEVRGHYRFRHSLTREAVYEDLLAPRREELHAAAAEVLRGRPEIPAVELCQHLLAAGRSAEAVPLGLAAADQAMRAHAYPDAAHLLERILPLVEDPRRRADLEANLGTAQLLHGDAARAERHLGEGVRALDRLGDHRAAAHHRLWLGRCLWERSRPEAARAQFDTARAQLEADGPSEDLALAHVRLASLAAFALDGAGAIEAARRAAAIAAAAGADAPRIWAYNYLGLGHLQLGQVAEGIEYVDRSYREAAAAGLNVIAANALYNGILVRIQQLRPLEAVERVEALKAMQAGSMARLQALRAEGNIHLWGLGQPGRALTAYREALVLAREGDAVQYVNWLTVQLAAANLLLDRFEDARRLLPDRSTARESQDRVDQLWTSIRLELDAGRPQAALAGAEEVLRDGGWPLRVRLFLGDVAVEALAAAGRVGEAGAWVDSVIAAGADPAHPWLLRMRGRLALAEGRAEDAAGDLRSAADAFGAAGCGHEEGRSRLALAEALAVAGSVEAARAELRATVESAAGRGSALEERLAREAMARLGSRTITTEHVKLALECMHRPAELREAALGRLLGMEPPGGADRLRALLSEQVTALAASADGREREAGQLLRDYYVRRVGSQELVADRLHLTRATFYRRLHLGWGLLAERLTPVA